MIADNQKLILVILSVVFQIKSDCCSENAQYKTRRRRRCSLKAPNRVPDNKMECTRNKIFMRQTETQTEKFK